jgi:hypothetical protein
MPVLPKRVAATVMAAAVVLSGLTGCGGDKKVAAEPGGEPTATATPTPTAPASRAAITPVTYRDPYTGIRDAASHMPATAAALAAALAKGPKVEGESASPAADLRATLTYLLTEHVYLVGLLVQTAYLKSPDADETAQARKAVDSNSKDLTAVLGKVLRDKGPQTPGPTDAGSKAERAAAAKEDTLAFLKGWDGHVDDLVDYAVAAKGEDSGARQEALDGLATYREEAGAFFADVTRNRVRRSTVTSALRDQTDALVAAIDGLAAAKGKGDGTGTDKLRAAAALMPAFAADLARGFAAYKGMTGDPAEEASDLRSRLTGLLTEHTYLADEAALAAFTNRRGILGEPYKAALATLEDNSQDLAKTIGGLSTSGKQFTFLTLWRSHINDFADYAVAAAKNDQGDKDAALDNLDRYRRSAGTFFAGLTDGGLKATAVSELLLMHVETLTGAIDALAGAVAT